MCCYYRASTPDPHPGFRCGHSNRRVHKFPGRAATQRPLYLQWYFCFGRSRAPYEMVQAGLLPLGYCYWFSSLEWLTLPFASPQPKGP